MSQSIDFGIPISKSKNPCFISYTREDATRIAGIVKALYKKGLPIWYDQGLVHSQDWEKQIAEKIDACCYVIAFLSNKTFSKENSVSVTECRLAAETYHKNVFYVLLEPIDSTNLRHEFALWWTKISNLHLITVEKTQTPTQIADAIYKAVKAATQDTSSNSKSDDSSAIAAVLAMIALFGCLLFGIAYSEEFSTESANNPATQESVVASEIYDETDSSIQIESENMITIYGGIKAPVEDFIFPYSSTELLTEEEMYAAFGSSDSEFMRMSSQAAINEIFARYGFTFTSNRDTGIAAREKFSTLSWYQEVQDICPTPVSEIILSDYMNDIERENIDRILSWRENNDISYN